MPGELKLSFIIEAVDRGTQVLDRIGQRMEAFGRSYSGIASMVGGGLEIKAAIDEDSYFRRLAALTRTPLEEMEKVRGGIHHTAEATRVSSSEIISAFDSFKQSGGSVHDFEANVENAGAAVALLGGHGAETGRIMAALERSFAVKGPKEMTSALALMAAQMGTVNTDVEAFAAAFPDMAERYSALGFSGQDAQRELTATYLALAQTSHSPRAAFGGVNEVMGVLDTEHSRMAFTGATGIRTEDQSGKARSLSDVIKDIVGATRDPNRSFLLENVMSGSTIDAFRKFGTEGGSKTYADLMKQIGNPADFLKQAHEATEGAGGVLQKMQEKFKSAADAVVTSLDGVTSALEKVDPELNVTTSGIAILGSVLFGVAAIGAGIAAVRNFKDAVSGLIDLMRKAPTKIPAAAAESAPAAAAAKAAPAAVPEAAAAGSSLLATAGRSNALRVGGAALQLGFMAGDMSRQIDEDDAARAKGPQAYADYEARKRQSFGEREFGWVPGLGDTDWNAPLPGSEWLRRQVGLPAAQSKSVSPPPVPEPASSPAPSSPPPSASIAAQVAPAPIAAPAPANPAPLLAVPPDVPALDRFVHALDRGTEALAAFTDTLIARYQRLEIAPPAIERLSRAPATVQAAYHPNPAAPRAPEMPAPIVTALDRSLPRGIRNNNPLNLEYHAGQGAVGSDGRFGVYASMPEGIAADYRQLLRYQARGVDTIDAIIAKWAPSSENNTGAYQDEVAKRTGFDPTAHLDLRDPAIASKLIAAMAHHESRDLDPDAIGDGVRLGIAGMRVPAIEEWSRQDDSMKPGAGPAGPVLQRFASAAPVNVGGQVVVQFENAPAGMRVKSIKSDHPDVALDVGMGLSMRNGTP